MGSALDILEAGRPPRAQFLNFPLGFEAGPYQDKAAQLDVMRQGLTGFETFTEPGHCCQHAAEHVGNDHNGDEPTRGRHELGALLEQADLPEQLDNGFHVEIVAQNVRFTDNVFFCGRSGRPDG